MITAATAELRRLLQARILLFALIPPAALGAIGAGLPPAPLVGALTVFIGGYTSALVAHLLATDFRSGVLRNQVLAHQARSTLLAGKLLAYAAIATTSATTAYLAALLASGASVPLERLGTLVASTVAYAAIGVLAAAFTRSPGPAVAITGLWIMSLDGLLGQLANRWTPAIAGWFPQHALTNLVALSHVPQGLTIAAAIITTATAASLGTFNTRDLA